MSEKVITKKAMREYRKSIKLTQEQFAKSMGVSVWTVRVWEQDKNNGKIPKRLLHDARTAHLAV